MEMEIIIFLAIIATSHCVELKCEFEYKNIIKEPVLNSCVVQKNFSIDQENETVSFENDQNKDLKICAGFIVEKQKVFYFPNDIGKIFTALKGLQITNSNLKKISSENLKNLTSLLSLDLSGNEIEVLEADTFKHNANISKIDLKNNKIITVETGTFEMEKLKQLTHLNLKNNLCISFETEKRGDLNKNLSTIDSNCWNISSQAVMKWYRTQKVIVRLQRSLDDFNQETQGINTKVDNISKNVLATVEESKNKHEKDLENISQNVTTRMTETKTKIIAEVKLQFDNFNNSIMRMFIDHKIVIEQVQNYSQNAFNQCEKILAEIQKIRSDVQKLPKCCENPQKDEAQHKTHTDLFTQSFNVNYLTILNTLLLFIITIILMYLTCCKSEPKIVDKVKPVKPVPPVPEQIPAYEACSPQQAYISPYQANYNQPFRASVNLMQEDVYQDLYQDPQLDDCSNRNKSMNFSNQLYQSRAEMEDIYSAMPEKEDNYDSKELYAVVNKR